MRLPKLIVAALGLVAVTTAAAPGWGPYIVRPGDSLWGLARAHHTTVAAIQQQNNLHGDLIRIGQTLDIPGLGAGAPAAASPGSTQAVGGSTTYRVRPGDTLTAIARAHHTTLAAIAALNHLSGRMTIYAGRIIQLPTVASVFVATPRSPAYAAAVSASAERLAGVADPGPAAIRALIAAEARRQGVPAPLAQAIAVQESGDRQRIVSATGAIGVMQLMPSTAAYLGVDPYDVNQNIRGGVTLLRRLLAATGSEPTAIAAYYQGLSAVRTRGLYPDTRLYVASVRALESQF
ncbi:MAG TPA: LysM peptidoglycan-binding domain-containing protein [Mycobacteriales bacterium]